MYGSSSWNVSLSSRNIEERPLADAANSVDSLARNRAVALSLAALCQAVGAAREKLSVLADLHSGSALLEQVYNFLFFSGLDLGMHCHSHEEC